MAGLTPLHRDIYAYISDEISRNGYPPTVREICARFKIKSTSTAYKYIKELEEQGLIVKPERLKRSIKLPGDNAVRVPVLGTVTAGQPILAVEEIEGYVTYNTNTSDKNAFFALHVLGESMINAGIFNGDIIIVRRGPAAQNGQIVVALIDDEATVKTFYKENGHFRLQPENDTMEPIIADDVAILGRVVALIRNY